MAMANSPYVLCEREKSQRQENFHTPLKTADLLIVITIRRFEWAEPSFSRLMVKSGKRKKEKLSISSHNLMQIGFKPKKKKDQKKNQKI